MQALVSISMINGRVESRLALVLQLVRFLPNCRLSYLGLITGLDVERITTIVLEGKFSQHIISAYPCGINWLVCVCLCDDHCGIYFYKLQRMKMILRVVFPLSIKELHLQVCIGCRKFRYSGDSNEMSSVTVKTCLSCGEMFQMLPFGC